MEENRHMMTNDDIHELPSLDEAPWLILNQRSYTREPDNQTICFMNNNKSCIQKTIVELHGKSYKYPSDDIVNALSSLAFSTCPTSADCLTVGLMCSGVVYFRAGNDHWEYAHIGFDSEMGIKLFESDEISRPKYHNGAFYILGNNGNLGVLKMVDGEWTWRVHKGPIPEEEAEDILLNSCQLVEIDDQLISVFIEGFGRKLHVFKFDTLGNDWVALDNLGDYMLFLSPASSFSVSTKDINMKNRIYLSKRIGNEMVFYSLNTGMYHTSSGQHPSKDFHGMRSQSFCCWI